MHAIPFIIEFPTLPQAIRAKRRKLPGGGAIAYGLGGAYLGGHNGRTAAEDVAVYRRAYEAGFRYFDVSSSKQYGRSEEHLGKFVKEIDREQVFLSSKFMPGPQTPLVRQLESGLENALRLMQTDHLDIFHLHDMGNFEEVVQGEVYDELRQSIARWKQLGKIRWFGIGIKNQRVLCAAMQSGLIEGILTHNELLPICPDALPLMRKAKARGFGVTHASPLAFGGLLAGGDPRKVQVHPSRATLHARAVEFYLHCQTWEIPVVAAALQFPLHFSEPDITLTGPGCMEHLESTISALSVAVPLEFWQAWFDRITPHLHAEEVKTWQAARESVLKHEFMTTGPREYAF